MIWNKYVLDRQEKSHRTHDSGERNTYYGCKVNVFFAFAQKIRCFFTLYTPVLTKNEFKRPFHL